jgi:diguanylate cyclase (GGDEF)-like protein
MAETRRWLDAFSRAQRAELLAWVWNTQDEGAVLLDADRRVLDANRAACAMLGASRDDLLGRALDNPPLGTDEVRCRTHHREASPDAELPPITLLTLTDVRSEVRARRAVERIAESVEEFLFTACLEGDRLELVYAGPGIERLIGGPVPPGQTVAETWFGAVHPEDVPIIRAIVTDARAGRPSAVEYRLVGLDGRVRWVRTRTQRRDEPDGVYLDGVVTEITPIRERERDMMRFRAMVEASRSAITLLDPDWSVRWMNPAGLALTALTEETAPGTPYVELVGDAARAEHLEAERAEVQRAGRWSGESVLLPVDRSRRPLAVEGTSYRIEDPTTGEWLGIACIRRDVSAAQRLAREHEAIGNLATAIAAGVGREEIYETACREAARLLDADAGGIATVTAHGARTVGTWRSSGAEHRLELATRRVAERLDAERTACSIAIDERHHAVGAPVVVDGVAWGLIVACRIGEGFAGEDERALARLGGLVGTAVEVARSRELLVRQATTDGLTGLFNHRAFHDALRHEAARAQRYDHPLAVVVFDLDGFKDVNDREGHHAGDRLLQAVAGVLDGVVRESEVVARLGGDEFALLLPETDVRGARAMAERVRAAVAALPQPPSYGVTVSAGVADLRQAGSADALIRCADRALYGAKARGRNHVSAADDGSIV